MRQHKAAGCARRPVALRMGRPSRTRVGQAFHSEPSPEAGPADVASQIAPDLPNSLLVDIICHCYGFVKVGWGWAGIAGSRTRLERGE
jgi:hypothetical protein